MKLTVWRLSPYACRVEPAEKTLKGNANKEAVIWCHPFSTANRLGWWIYPPADLDVTWDGEKLSHEMHGEYPSIERSIIQQLSNRKEEVWWNRSKFTWGLVEPNVFQMWTGLIFQTPPGWSLLVRSPINHEKEPFHIMEGVIEADWMQYDIWLNVVMDNSTQVAKFRRAQNTPIAQIIPVQRAAYSADWELETRAVENATEEGNRVFSFWYQYNVKKFNGEKKQPLGEGYFKDAKTFYRERNRCLDASEMPIPAQLAPKRPFSRAKTPVIYSGIIKPMTAPKREK